MQVLRLKFILITSVFRRFPSIRWKLSKHFPSLFFYPHMKSQEYLLFKSIPYKGAVILEFGSGGSTVHFLKQAKKTYSVESNFTFYKYMKSIFLIKKACKKSLFLKFVSIGDTDTWGRPVSGEKKANWRSYYSDIWKEIILKESKVDIIFIDGRFRVSCCLYAVLQVLELNWEQPVFVVHDFIDRKEYYVLLEFLDEVECKHRLSVFTMKKDIEICDVKAALDTHAHMTD